MKTEYGCRKERSNRKIIVKAFYSNAINGKRYYTDVRNSHNFVILKYLVNSCAIWLQMLNA